MGHGNGLRSTWETLFDRKMGCKDAPLAAPDRYLHWNLPSREESGGDGGRPFVSVGADARCYIMAKCILLQLTTMFTQQRGCSSKEL